jgi:hypothetical protein
MSGRCSLLQHGCDSATLWATEHTGVPVKEEGGTFL